MLCYHWHHLQTGRKPAQVRVVQGSEPQEFVELFAPGFIVLQGGATTSSDRSTGARLFHVKHIGAGIRTIEIDPLASNLNSGDAFVSVPAASATDQVAYTWAGKFASVDEVTAAGHAATALLGHLKALHVVEAISEGAEPEAFWEQLGGTYPSLHAWLCGMRWA